MPLGRSGRPPNLTKHPPKYVVVVVGSLPCRPPPPRVLPNAYAPTRACTRMSVTDAEHHVQAIMDLLEAADAAEWATAPDVREYWADAQSERGPGADQPPILYVWSPTGSSLERFSMDGDKFDRSDSVEVQAWSLVESEVERLQRDVTRILSGYLDDNNTATPYTDVAPVAEEDFREQTPARQTSHYVMSVEVETTGLQDTGK